MSTGEAAVELELSKLIDTVLKALEVGTQVETRTLELKRDWYPSPTKDELGKDVAAVANSLRDDVGWILFGIAEARPFLHGVGIPPDEASIQQMIRARIQPLPLVSIVRVERGGKPIIGLRIMARNEHLPYVAGIGDQQHVWVRRGTGAHLAHHADFTELFERRFDATRNAALEVAVLVEIRRLDARLTTAGWAAHEDLLEQLSVYVPAAAPRIAHAVIDALRSIEGRLRHPPTADVTRQRVASQVCRIAEATIDIHGTSMCRLLSRDPTLATRVTDLAHGVAYDGIRKLRSPSVVGAGAELLWTLLRHATRNALDDVASHSLATFDELIDVAQREGFTDAARWLEFRKADALAAPGTEARPFPTGLMEFSLPR